MADELQTLLALHRDHAQFPHEALAQLKDWNLEAGTVIPAWELSGLAPGLEGAERKALFAVALALRAAQAQGHTRLSLAPGGEGPAQELYRAFGLEGFDARRFLESPLLEPLAGPPGCAKPLVLAGPWLYSQRILDQEEDLSTRIQARLAMSLEPALPPGEEVFLDPVALNPDQRRAVTQALAGPLTLITGGPGTGKTSIVISILRALLRQPGLDLVEVALAAPTGKAAQRMGEALRSTLARLDPRVEADRILATRTLEARTLHRLLAWHPASGHFRHGPANPLPLKVLIVDEASMISQEHMDRLLGALAPGTRLMLLGDADQLPSVEPGCAFRDMVERLPDCKVSLRESYRMSASDPDGRNILSVAQAVNRPGTADLWGGSEPIQIRPDPAALAFRQVELLEPATGLGAFLRLWFERQVTGHPEFPSLTGRTFGFRRGEWDRGDRQALGALFTHFEGFRILCALREAGDLRGVEEINALLHQWMLAMTGEGLRGAAPFCAGEPVLMTANDYRRGIFNGDQGLVLKVRFEDQVRQAAVFPKGGGFEAFPLEPLRGRLDHAYAMTIHKSQGSEYTRIAIVLPRNNHRALTRELLYTGLTRARKGVVLLAERERVAFACGNPTRRDSGLGERLDPEGPSPTAPATPPRTPR